MLKMATRTFEAIGQFDASESEKLSYKARADKYNSSCGCPTGGAFLTAGILGCIPYWIYFPHNFTTFLKAIIGVLLLAFLGKMTGLLSAYIRLFLLYKTVSKKLNQQNNSYVHLH